MSSPRRIAWLSAETPDRGGGGGHRRQFHQIRVLVDRGVDVRAGTLAGPQDDGSLREMVPVVRFGPLRRRGLSVDPGLENFLEAGRFDGAVVAHLESVPHVRRALARRGLPWLLDLHNVNSRWHALRGERAATAVWRLRERAAVRAADVATVCSAEERDALTAGLGSTVVEVAGHGIDPAEWPDEALAGERAPAVAFFGAWGHGPNRQGVEWLVQHVWPRITAARPDARLLLAGPGQPPAAAAGVPGVEHAGRVENLAAFLGGVRVVVVPILDGIGARVKFVEALASGAAVVSTSAGAEGFDAEGAFVRADDTEEFAVACTTLLDDEARVAQIGRAGRERAFQRFDWARTSEPLVRFAHGAVA